MTAFQIITIQSDHVLPPFSVGAHGENIGDGAVVGVHAAVFRDLHALPHEKHGRRIAAVQVDGVGAAHVVEKLRAFGQGRAVGVRLAALDQQPT